jgi:sulfur-carrier protein
MSLCKANRIKGANRLVLERTGLVASSPPPMINFLSRMVPPTIMIHVPGPLRAYCAGATQLSISAHTVRAALEDLQRSQSALYRNLCDETGTVRRHLNVFVNSDNVRDLDGVDTTLTPGDVVTILPAVSGG